MMKQIDKHLHAKFNSISSYLDRIPMTFGAGLGFLGQLDAGEDELEYGGRDVVVPCSIFQFVMVLNLLV